MLLGYFCCLWSECVSKFVVGFFSLFVSLFASILFSRSLANDDE